VLFAERGVSVVALEPSAEMAAVARRNCAAYSNVTIEETEFEPWRPDGRRFRLVFSAQAWHWLSPDVRCARARAALEPGGVLAAFWNIPDWPACELRDALGEVYERHGLAGDSDLDLLGTHSACLVLESGLRDRLLSDIAEVIDARGGEFRLPLVTLLCLARAT
jgi:SAM-dependent methyltransferase